MARERAAAAEHLETIRRLTAKAVEARDAVRELAVKRADARREAFAAKMADQRALAALKRATFRETFVDGFRIPYPPADLLRFEQAGYSPDVVAAELANESRMTWVAERGTITT